jgi:hypothetical protein
VARAPARGAWTRTGTNPCQQTLTCSRPRARGAKGSLDAPEREVLAGVGLERPLPPPPGLPGPPGSGPAPASSAGPGPGAAGAAAAQGALPGPPALPAGALKLVKKAQKRAAKEARKVREPS